MRIERLSLQDKQEMKYLVQTNTRTAVPEQSDGEIEYIEIDGVSVPLETGYYEIGHETTTSSTETVDNIVDFIGNITFSGGETHLEEFGVNSSDYDAILVMPKDSLPITETSYIWYDSDVVYEDDDDTRVDTSSADFKVVKVIPSLGIKRYLLKKVVN